MLSCFVHFLGTPSKTLVNICTFGCPKKKPACFYEENPIRRASFSDHEELFLEEFLSHLCHKKKDQGVTIKTEVEHLTCIIHTNEKNGFTARNAKNFAKDANIDVYSLRTLRILCNLCGKKKNMNNTG